MYLECLTNVQFDNCHWPTQWHFGVTGMATKYEFDQLKSCNDPFRQWDSIVRSYSRLHLTNATDRLPALSGLVSHFQSATGAEYLAGLWVGDIPRALAWYVPPWRPSKPVFLPTSSYLAPSWSWAAGAFGVTLASCCCMGPFHSDADIITARATPAGADLFGAVKDGFIHVSGRVQRGVVEKRPDTSVPGRRTLYLLSGNSDRSAIGTYAPDRLNEVNSCGFSVLLLYLGTGPGGSGAAIAIRAVDGKPGIYSRVGLAVSEGKGLWELFEDIERTVIRLI